MKPITWSFAICTDCEKIWGNKASNWPDWLRYSWKQEQRDRRRIRRETLNEVPIYEDNHYS